MKKYYWIAGAIILILIALLPFTCGNKNGVGTCKPRTTVEPTPTPVAQIIPPAVKPAAALKTSHNPVKQADKPVVSVPTSRIQVSTLAGSKSVGTANGKGTAASFNNPAGIALDNSGNLYIADSGNNLIRKITAAGLVTTLAGSAGVTGSTNGIGTAASFWHPWGVAVDSTGNVYVSDQLNAVIRKITSGGLVSTLAGTAGVFGSTDGTGPAASFFEPAEIAVDSSGNIYVADSGNNIIRKITSSGVVTTLAGSEKAVGAADATGAAASFNSPQGVVVDPNGNVYIADAVNDLIRKITPEGVVTTLAGSVGVIGSGNGTGTAATFNTPFGITVDKLGNVFVADTTNQLIRKITPEGVVTTLAGLAGIAGSINGAGNNASFNTPFGITVDASENLYVADTTNQLIRKISQ